MSRKAEKARADARQLRDRLKYEGRHRDAQVLQTLILSAESAGRLNEALSQDNLALRDRIKTSPIDGERT